ncbi:PcfJ domain-containing protein [Luminiphilus sp.]|nr:PcfJ domain-containing protein [Luminiphilus sp.]
MANLSYNESLEIDWTQSLGHRCMVMVAPWNKGLGGIAIDDDEQTDITLREVGDWVFGLTDPAVLTWKEGFPADVLQALEAMPSHKAHLAEYASKSSSIKDLLLSNPILLWGLCEYGFLDDISVDEIEELTRLKQRDLAKHLKLEGTKQQVRLLKWMSGVSRTKDELRSYIRLLKHRGVCNYLSHAKGDFGQDLKFLTKHPWLASCPARALITLLSDQEHWIIFRDILRMTDDITELQQCATIKALNRLHDRLVVELNQWRRRELIRNEYGQPVSLPQPPLPATVNIIPITSQAELIEEGREMHHCIASHLKSVVEGKFAVYRMIAPERLTIEVLVIGEGQLGLREVRGKCNRLPSAASSAIIEAWFSKGLLTSETRAQCQ